MSLDLYTWTTPNGKKVPILLAELGWEYELRLVDLQKNEQKLPSYLAINPNGKIPALVDTGAPHGERVVVFESGAILQYLADKAGRFLAPEGQARWDVLSWLYWQIGGVGPMFGQLAGFEREKERDEHAIEKFLGEAKRLAGVLEERLAKRVWICDAYSIADIACYPWVAAIAEKEPRVFDGTSEIRRWMGRMEERPAVAKGMALEKSVKVERGPISGVGRSPRPVVH